LGDRERDLLENGDSRPIVRLPDRPCCSRCWIVRSGGREDGEVVVHGRDHVPVVGVDRGCERFPLCAPVRDLVIEVELACRPPVVFEEEIGYCLRAAEVARDEPRGDLASESAVLPRLHELDGAGYQAASHHADETRNDFGHRQSSAPGRRGR